MAVISEPILADREFKAFQKMIFDLAGISLANTKQVMVQGRLSRRLRELELGSFAEYLKYLQENRNDDEVTKFINALTTNKTAFFREKHHFDFLMNKAFPQIRDRAQGDRQRKVRIWCSASSTGEEPYTIAMCAREFFGGGSEWDIRILASDIDTNVLETASKGSYREDLVEDVPRELLTRYFDCDKDVGGKSYQARATLRDLITFRRLNLSTGNWPINTTFDVIFCRNVMIYFNSATQQGVIERFAEKLHPNGYLIMGHSESLFGISDAFKPIGETVYQLIDGKSANKHAPKPERRQEPSSHSGSQVCPHTGSQSNAKSAAHSGSHTSSSSGCPMSGGAAKSGMVSSAHASSKPVAVLNQTVNATLGDAKRHPIIVGEVFASSESIWASTLLGSCVAACLYDDVSHVGGINHFMLPSSARNSSDSASLGVHAMELLINEIMKIGGNRRRLKAKLFGGAAVMTASQTRVGVGEQNVAFAKRFLETENIPLVASHTGGANGMHVYFNTQSAKAILRPLDSQASLTIHQDQLRHAEELARAQKHQDITLF